MCFVFHFGKISEIGNPEGVNLRGMIALAATSDFCQSAR